MEVGEIFTDWLAAKNNLKAREEQLQYRQEAYRNLEKQFETGRASSLDLLTAKTSLEQAQSSWLQARYEYLFNSKLMDFYAGKEIKL